MWAYQSRRMRRALGAVGVDQQVADDQQPTGLERLADAGVEAALLGAVRDVVQRQRRHRRVAAWERVVERCVAHLEPSGVRLEAGGGRFQHVRVDVDEQDVHVRQRVQDRRRQRAGAGAEVDDQPAGRHVAVEPRDDGLEHPLVVRDEGADGLVVLVRDDPEVARDAMLLAHAWRVVRNDTPFLHPDRRPRRLGLAGDRRSGRVPRRAAGGGHRRVRCPVGGVRLGRGRRVARPVRARRPRSSEPSRRRSTCTSSRSRTPSRRTSGRSSSATGTCCSSCCALRATWTRPRPWCSARSTSSSAPTS